MEAGSGTNGFLPSPILLQKIDLIWGDSRGEKKGEKRKREGTPTD